MMITTIPEILQRVNGSLTTEERNRIPQDNFTHFFQSLVQIYEEKAEKYFTSCRFGAKRLLQGEVDEKIMEYAYTIFFERNEAVLLVSLRLLLKRQNANLLNNLGLSGDTAKAVFKSYAARLRLFRELGLEQLRLVDGEINQTSPELFPRYLIEAFEIQSGCGDKQRLHQYVQGYRELVYESLRGQLSYIQTLVPNSQVEERARFINLISQGYLQQLTEDVQRLLLEDHTVILQSNIATPCQPAMRFLGVNCVRPLDFSEARTRLDQANQVLATRSEEAQTRAREEIQTRKAAAIESINTAVRNVPQNWTVIVGTGGTF